MQDKSLYLVLDMEKKREDQAAVRLQQARQQCEMQRSRLAGLEQYRTEYLNSALERGQGGLQSMRFGHYHAFIGKLDEGIGQQRIKLQRLEQVVTDRQQYWVEKQQRRKAIEHLLEKKRQQAALRQNRREQATADEYATQGFMRRLKQQKH
ncbi:flagellar export protein FliJ [Aliidiomarina sedimenti]|uniref:Flagellar FliJ protein n=2 Tax=Aliidiomarina TaxID=1249554 RepID=A0A432WEH6_9GAMM|nr:MULTISPECIES: flagellar export protein FliJ [Aliidiomarina]RUO28002.1 flagellar export protein FliJ [Aliidiomarina sedimenti]RUO31284.1 flagellar export protein FliJ [Aliidiomarina soli]